MIAIALGYNSNTDKTEVILPDNETRIKVDGRYQYGMEVNVSKDQILEAGESCEEVEEEKEYVEPYIPYWAR
jgi:threonine dehydratase